MSEEPMDEKAVFNIARRIESREARADYLQQVCGADPEAMRRVVELLRLHEQEQSFLESPAVAAQATIDQPVAQRPGTVIGPYKLLQQIGEGGMGTVYMAEQSHPVQRKVALKVIKAGMDSVQVIARFEAERQALALMDHPSIAKVLDAGTTSAGRPYFVMELVRGVPITTYCDENHLPPKARLELFTQVCQAVQHAHHKGVIHRDLKPTNVLVTLYDDKPVPKVIDFGVAKATGGRLTERTMFTGFGQIVGTLEYMSPEQARLNALDIDTRGDVYSLGVLLYELLTGTTPFDKKRLREAAFDEMLRIVREEEPPKPSTRLSTTEARASIAASRGMEPNKLSGLVRGELDWIVMKALEKDRNRRYETANGLAMDVQRYLHDEQVLACPPSASYRLRKLVRRNKVAIVTASVIVAALVLGIAVSTWQAIRATRARQDAEIARTDEATQRAVADRRRIEADDQRQQAESARDEAETQRRLAEGNLKKARDAVDQMLTRVSEERLRNVPQMEPVRKGLLEDALKFYQEFLHQKSDDPAVRLETARCYFRTGSIRAQLGQTTEAEQDYGQSVALLEKLVADSPADLNCRRALANAYSSLGNVRAFELRKQPEAEAVFRQALAIRQKLAAEYPDSPEHRYYVIGILRNLSGPLQATGRLAEAEEILRQGLALSEKLAADFPLQYDTSRASSHFVLAGLLARTKRPQEAEQAYRQAVSILERHVDKPGDQWNRYALADAVRQLGDLLLQTGRRQEAEEAYRQAIPHYEQVLAHWPNSPAYRRRLVTVYLALGGLLSSENRIEEAEQAYRAALNHSEKLVSQVPAERVHWERLTGSQELLVGLLAATDRAEDVEKIHRQAIALGERIMLEFPEKTDLPEKLVQSYDKLASFLTQAGRSEDAELAFRQIIALEAKLAAEFPPEKLAALRLATGQAWRHVGDSHSHRGENLAAEKAFQESIALLEKLVAEFSSEPNYRVALADSYQSLANLLSWALGRNQEAERPLYLCLALREKLGAEDPSAVGNLASLVDIQRTLANVLGSTNRDVEAEAAHRKAIALAQKLSAEFPTVSHYRSQQAGSLCFLGMLLAKTHRPQEAEKTLRQAMEMQERLFLEEPDSMWRGLELCLSQRELGKLLRQTARREEAEKLYDQSLTLAEKVASEFPNFVTCRAQLGETYVLIGELLAANNRTQEAEQAFRRGQSILEKLVAETHSVPYWRGLLFSNQDHLVNLLKRASRPQEAEQVCRQIVALFEKLVADVPEAPDYRRELAGRHQVLGDLLRDTGRPHEAVQAYRQAVAVQEKLVSEVPDNAEWQSELGVRLHQLGIVLSELGELTEVRRVVNQAIDRQHLALKLNPKGSYRNHLRWHYHDLALVLVKLGEHAETAQTLENLLQLHVEEDWCRRFAVERLARCAQLAENDPKLPETERPAVTAAYAERTRQIRQEVIRRTIAQTPDSLQHWPKLAKSYLDLGSLLAKSNQPTEAEQAYREAIALCEKLAAESPENAESHQVMATVLNNGAWYLATSPAAHFRATDVRIDSTKAVKLAQKAVELTPKAAHVWNTLGVAQYRAQDWKPAIESLEKSEALDPGKHVGFNGFFLAMAEWQMGHKEQARTWHDQAVEWMEKNQPQNEELKRFRAEAAELMNIDPPPSTLPE